MQFNLNCSIRDCGGTSLVPTGGKHKAIPKFLSVLLTLCMVTTMLPFTAFASDYTWDSSTPPSVTDGDTVTVTGRATGTLTIPAGATVTIIPVVAGMQAIDTDIDLGSGATVIFDTTGGNLFWHGIVSGAGNLTKNGANNLNLTRANTYVGATAINGGMLNISYNEGSSNVLVPMDTIGSIGDSSGVTIASGATLYINASSASINSLSGDGTVSLSRNTLTIVQSADTMYSGVISGTGNLTKAGPGALTLTGANTYTGDTTLAYNGGTLLLAADYTVPAGSELYVGNLAALTVNNGATLTLTDCTINPVAGCTLNVDGMLVRGDIEISNNTLNIGSTGVLNGDLYISGASGAVTIASGGGITGTTSVYGGSLTSAGNLNGDFDISGGTVNIAGNVGGDLTVSGGEVTISGTVGGTTTHTGGTLNGSTPSGASATGTLSIGGAIAVTDLTANGSGAGWTWTAATSTFTLIGDISGDIEFTGTGDIIFSVSGTHTVTGSIVCDAGKLTINGGGTLNVTLPSSSTRQQAIRAYNGLTIENVTVIADGSARAASRTVYVDAGGFTMSSGTLRTTGVAWGLQVLNGDISISGTAEVTGTATSTTASMGYGIDASYGSITIGGNAVVVGVGSEHQGIYGADEITINGGTVTVKAAPNNPAVGAIRGGIVGITVNGGALTVGDTGASPVNGNVSGNLAVSDAGANVTVNGSIVYGGNLTVSGGAVNVAGTVEGAQNLTGGTVYVNGKLVYPRTDITAGFPDTNFLAEVRSALGKGASDPIYDDDDFASVLYLDVSDKNIASLAGIEYFTALTMLLCHDNQLTALDVNTNTALVYLICSGNQLTALDLSANATLINLICNNNKLRSLDVGANTALAHLACSGNQLTALDMSANTVLQYLNCSGNQLAALDVNANTALTDLICAFNQLTALDVSANTALADLDCSYNQLTALDVSANTALTDLDCSENQLTALDISVNTALTDLICSYNQLTALDVSANTALADLICYSNQLMALNVSANTALAELDCSHNQLTALDVSANTALEDLDCQSNRLTGLTLSGLATYSSIDARYNYMTGTGDITGNTSMTWDSPGFYFTSQHAAGFYAVTNITGVPASAAAGVPLTLTGTVVPSDATNRAIVWSISFGDNGSTGASVSGNMLNTLTAGTATITATIIDGTASGVDFEKDFSITVSATTDTTPVITIDTEPAAVTNVTYGSISGSLTVAANATQSAGLDYQWYSNTTNSAVGGTLIPGADYSFFTIPTTLDAGTYYYFCEVSATGATSIRSAAATVTVDKGTYAGITTVSKEVLCDTAATGITVTLPALPDGASYPTTGTVGGATPALIASHSIVGTTLTMNITAQANYTTAMITVPAANATNYHTYNVIVTITAQDIVKESTPTAFIDYMTEKLAGLEPGAAYTVNGTAKTADASGNIVIEAAWFNTTISIVKTGVTPSIDSDSQNLPIPARPAAPSGVGKTDTTGGNINGTITGVNSTMAYKPSTEMHWTDITGISVTGLASGTYNVRYKATTGAFASAPTANLVIASSTSGGGGSTGGSGGGTPAPTTPTTPATPGDNKVTTPPGQPPVADSNGNTTLPGGGTVKTSGDSVIDAPAGTTIDKNGNITIPLGKEAELTLPGGQEITLPGGSVIDGSGKITTGGGTKVDLPGDKTLDVPKGSAISNDGKLTIGAGGATFSSGGISMNIAAGAAVIFDEDVPLGYFVSASNPFTDVRSSGWYYNSVMFAYTHGLMAGTSTNPMLFSPDRATTRGMIVTILYRMAGTKGVPESRQTFGERMSDVVSELSGSPGSEQNEVRDDDVGGLANPFSDVAGDKYYTDAVKWAAANGIVSGYGDGLYGPEDNITREQLAVILNNFITKMGMKLPTVREYAGFNDDTDIANYAKEAIERFFKAGIAGGKPGNNYDPKGNATRAEVAAMLINFLGAITPEE